MLRSKKTKLFLASIIVLGSLGILFAQILKHPRGITLPIKKVEKRWGKQKFDLAKFKLGDKTSRAAMAASLIKNKDLIGKTNAEIFKLLGYGDGYYFSDLIPAYLIEDNSLKGGEVWQIVFILGNQSKVKSIHVHKNGSELR